MGEIIYTKESLKKLKEELKYLKTVKRKEITAQIKEAKEFGDLSENAAYKAAREAEALNESRIQKLERLIKNAKIVNNSHSQESKIFIGAKVTLERNGRIIEYTIVDQSQVDYKTNKISVNSPLAKALIGKKGGDIISVFTPKGDELTYKIISIQ